MRPLKRFRQTGFVLVEILLAVVILAIGLTAVLQSMTAQARAAGAVGLYVFAVLVLVGMMAPFFMGPASLPLPETEVTCLPDTEAYQCSLRAALTLPSPHPQVVFEGIDSQVKWSSGKKQRTLNVWYFNPKVLEK